MSSEACGRCFYDLLSSERGICGDCVEAEQMERELAALREVEKQARVIADQAPSLTALAHLDDDALSGERPCGFAKTTIAEVRALHESLDALDRVRGGK